jgi:divalent metal cation (Fe/Co/Zn/Cd) transporter
MELLSEKNILQHHLYKKAFLLSIFTIVYNIIEGFISIYAGKVSGTVSLLGFGIDSFAESLSGFVVAWRFFNAHKFSIEENEKKERRATILVGYTFFIFGTYVLYEVINKIILREAPRPSLLGIIILILSIIIMPVLFYLKYKTAKQLNSKSLAGDAKETLVCSFLSLILLIGILVNYFWGLWQLDPVLGLVVVLFLFKEGYYTLKEKDICSC